MGPPSPAGGRPTASSPPGMFGRSLHRCHRLGEGLPGLPAGQGPPLHTGTSATHPSTHLPFRPHPGGPGGPLPASKGFTYLFAIIDRTSRWPEAIPITATSTVDCANALFQGWVSRFGVPAVITSDRGTQLTSSLALCSLLDIQHSQTTAGTTRSRTLPPLPQGRPLRRGELGRPPPMGPPGSPRNSQGRRRLHPRSGSVRFTTHFTWPIFRFSRITFKNFS
jgi:hypothetical protein